MGFVGLSITLELDPLVALGRDLQHVTDDLHDYVRTEVLPALQPYIDAALNKPGPPRRGKFVFATLASQRYYFATHKEPYRRTGAVLAWKALLRIDGTSGEITLVNPMPYAQYVFGAPGQRQVIGHYLTGWTTTDKEVVELVGPASRLVRDGWFVVAPFSEEAA